MKKAIGTLPFILFCTLVFSQHKLSIDLAGIRQLEHESNGMNFAAFYHFNEHLSGGIEINRFFPLRHIVNEEENKLSAWDLELNFHYYIGLKNNIEFYPIGGLGHTSEKESLTVSTGNHFEQFWSLNTGAGLLWQWKKWVPHVEYYRAWGKVDQQFVLAGVSYKIEW
jgi:hypothetical protein